LAIIAIVAFSALLFSMVYISISQLLTVFAIQRKTRLRLQYVQHARIGFRFARQLTRFRFLYRHVSDMLEAVSSRWTVVGVTTVSGILLIAGLLFGALFFQSVKGMIMLTVMIASVPYLLLRLRLLSLRLKTRLEFLPAVEVFYQYYLIYGRKNVKHALKICLDENRIQYPMKPVFELLYRNLMTSRGVEASLRLFAMTLGHIWSEYFTNILRVALTEGNRVDESLRDLIADMRKAQRSDQAERNKLLEIRVANFTPILFLALFVGLNFKLNPDSAYSYYILDSNGRGMLLDALILIFVSFLMGIYLSMKRM